MTTPTHQETGIEPTSVDTLPANAGTPASVQDKLEYARCLAQSGLLPKEYRHQPQNVLYAVEYGAMLGLSPMAAITGIHVIDGKPSASAALISGLVRSHGHKLRVRMDRETMTATCTIVRMDDADFEFTAQWTIDRAVRAGLCQRGKDGMPYQRDSKGRPTAWEKYPEALLKARAITEVARDACQDALFGLSYTPEELGANVNADGIPLEAAPITEHTPKPHTADYETEPVTVVEDTTVADAEPSSTPEPAMCAGTAESPEDHGGMTITDEETGHTRGMCQHCSHWVRLHNGAALPHDENGTHASDQPDTGADIDWDKAIELADGDTQALADLGHQAADMLGEHAEVTNRIRDRYCEAAGIIRPAK